MTNQEFLKIEKFYYDFCRSFLMDKTVMLPTKACRYTRLEHTNDVIELSIKICKFLNKKYNIKTKYNYEKV